MYSIAPCVCMFLTNGRNNKNVTCAIQYFHEVQYTVQYLPPVCAIQYIHEVQYSAVFASSMCIFMLLCTHIVRSLFVEISSQNIKKTHTMNLLFCWVYVNYLRIL